MRTTLCLAAVCVLVLAGCKPTNSEKPATPPAKSFTPAAPTPLTIRPATVPAPNAYPDARYYDSTNAWARPALSRSSFYDTPKTAPVAPKSVASARTRTTVASKAATSKVKLATKARKPSTALASKTATRSSTKTVALAKKPAAKSSKTLPATRVSSSRAKPAKASSLAI